MKLCSRAMSRQLCATRRSVRKRDEGEKIFLFARRPRIKSERFCNHRSRYRRVRGKNISLDAELLTNHRPLESVESMRFYRRSDDNAEKGKRRKARARARARGVSAAPHGKPGRLCTGERFIASVKGRRDARRHITIIHFVNSAHLYNGFRVRIKSEQLYSFSVAWRESKCLLAGPGRARVLIIFCEAFAHYFALPRPYVTARS